MNNLLNKIFSYPQYSLSFEAKESFFIDFLVQIFRQHKLNSKMVNNILNSLNYNETKISGIEDFPFLPVGIFKELELFTVKRDNILKILYSSGTTGQKVSKIFLDAETAKLQSKALGSIVNSYIGKQRLPMIILDSEDVLKNRKSYSARGAGILGFFNFGRDHFFALDSSMRLRKKELLLFLDKYSESKVLLFGFTYILWKHFIEQLLEEKLTLNLSRGVLFHSGGWKKLKDEKVENSQFKEVIENVTGITKVFNFYGMVEQVGSIYMECEEGYFHSSNFSEIIIRDLTTYAPVKTGEKGLIQTLSLLPLSYPGNSILTEDVGIVYGKDDCLCGRKGTYFKVLGRLPKAELRGCSDTYSDKKEED